MKTITSPMEYLDSMDQIDSPIMNQVLTLVKNYNPENYTKNQVEQTLKKEKLLIEDFAALLSPAALGYLEPMAQKAKQATRKFFGNCVSLFTPLYIANFCENHCIYCGFHCKNKIIRGALTMVELEEELKEISKTGLQEILLLTGESRYRSSVSYIGDAIQLASKYFSTVGIEIYPLNTEEYSFLKECGADFVSVYQETYQIKRYEQVHKSGPKRVFPYRFYAQERALSAGFRGVAFGSLLGLADYPKDAFATGLHGYFTQQKYPHGEIAFSTPRLRPIPNSTNETYMPVYEKQLLQVILAYRLFMPYAGITISTRERPVFRDHIVGLAATKISAGVHVGVGGHKEEQKGDEQFEISDSRSVKEIHEMILNKGLQPVYQDYIRL